MMVCQLYDNSFSNATLIGVEYMIDSKTYQTLPDREKPNWHYHKEEFSPDRANPKFPLLNDSTTKRMVGEIVRVIWKGNTNLESSGYIACIPSSDTTGTTSFYGESKSSIIITEKYIGSFNQTLDY